MRDEVATLLAATPRPASSPSPPGAALATCEVLGDLAARWPRAPDREQRSTLDSIMRKVHLAGTVSSHYGPGWKRLPDAPALDIAGWRLLTTVLLAYACGERNAAADSRGFRAKCLNAALVAIDRTRDRGEEISELQAVADRLLEQWRRGEVP